MTKSWEEIILTKLLQKIDNIKEGLDPDVLNDWFKIIEDDAKNLSPDDLKDKIEVKQDPVLWMKFNLKASRRTVNYIITAIEKNLPKMPFATNLYFQKVEELLKEETFRFDYK